MQRIGLAAIPLQASYSTSTESVATAKGYGRFQSLPTRESIGGLSPRAGEALAGHLVRSTRAASNAASRRSGAGRGTTTVLDGTTSNAGARRSARAGGDPCGGPYQIVWLLDQFDNRRVAGHCRRKRWHGSIQCGDAPLMKTSESDKVCIGDLPVSDKGDVVQLIQRADVRCVGPKKMPG